MDMGNKVRKSERRLSFSYLLLLAQGLLAVHGKSFTSEQLISLSSLMMRLLPKDENNIDCRTVLARALNGLLLCHMYMSIEGVWGYVKKYS
jgi:hypothetical protein